MKAVNTLVFCLIAIFAAAQTNTEIVFDKIENGADIKPTFYILKCDIYNIVNVMNTPIGTFEALLTEKGYDYQDDMYFGGNYKWGYQIVNRQEGVLSIGFMDNQNVEQRTRFNAMLDQLSTYYVGREENFAVYGFEHKGKLYTFKADKSKLMFVIKYDKG